MKPVSTFRTFAAIFVFVLCASEIHAQSPAPVKSGYLTKKAYTSFEYEIIFSFASITAPEGINIDQNMRWSPVFNPAGHLNYDVSENFGLNIGVALRNVGFIAKFDADPNDPQGIDRIKFRTYNAGLPIGFKIGDLNQNSPTFFFAGYEFEVPLHYKEKPFQGRNKEDNTTSWFTGRTPNTMHSVFAGIQLSNGVAVKAKYYLTEFFNPDFSQTTDGVVEKPFENFNANVFYFSLEFYPFRQTKGALESF
jgi:hypothetical protein